MKIIIGILTFITCAFLFLLANTGDNDEHVMNSRLDYNTARILAVINDDTFVPEVGDPHFYGSPDGLRLGTITYEILVTNGMFLGLVLEADYHMNSPAHVEFSVGDYVSVRIFEYDNVIRTVEVRHPERMSILWLLIASLLLFLCVIGGKRGILAVAGLVFAVLCVMFLLIPLLIIGFSPLIITLVILLLITVVTIVMLAGTTSKSLIAISGSVTGVILALTVATIASNLVHVSGYNLTNASAIMNLSDSQVGGLFVSSVLIASIGALMDACMSVASALVEIQYTSPEIKQAQLFRSGFNISRDIIGTMSSTLILAFLGSGLTVFVFMQITNVSMNQFLNNDFVVMEVIKGVAGSFGIILAAPLTALIGSYLLTSKRGLNNEKINDN